MGSPTVLLTGASGFVGSSVWRRLEYDGVKTCGLGRRPLGRPNYIRHDLRQPLDLDVRPDAVVHAAALSSPWGRRREFESCNIAATENVLKFCMRVGRPRVVYISSSSVYYENADQRGLTEESPFPARPINLYAATKREAENRVMAYPGQWTILRPRAVFGPGDFVLFPRILAAARAGRLPLLVRKDTEVVGDLIYIDNLVDMIVKAVRSNRIRGVFNLTNNNPVPIVATLVAIFERLGISPPTRRIPLNVAMLAAGMLETMHRAFSPTREPAMTRFGIGVFAYSKTFDVSRMLATFGEPRVSIEDGIDRFVAWIERCDPY